MLAQNETVVKTTNKTVKSLAVVMPVYNEGEHIYANLLEASRIVGSFAEDYEIVAVNDGSTDNSLEEIRRAMKADDHIRVVYYDQNHGKGYAVKLGMMTSGKELTAFCDSDLELTPKMLKSYARALRQSGADIVITEIGGTVGDIESQPFIEALRQIQYEKGSSDTFFIHCTLVPFIYGSNELKTKPTQNSVKDLRNMGIRPDALVIRVPFSTNDHIREKLSLFCSVLVGHLAIV